MISKTLGYLLLAQGNFDECKALKQREFALVQDIGDVRLIGITLAEIGETLCHMGKYLEAEEYIRRGMALVKDRSMGEYALRHRYLGDALVGQGKYSEAREAYQVSYHFFESINEKGWSLTALTGLSRAELALGKQADAWRSIRQALQLYRELHLYTFFVYLTLAQVALLLADRGEATRAVALYRIVNQQEYLAQSHWFAEVFGKTFAGGDGTRSVDERIVGEQFPTSTDISEIVEDLLDTL